MSGKSSARKKLSTLLKLSVSLGLIVLVYSGTNRRHLLHQLGSISFGTACLLIFLYTFGQVLSTLKWRVFLQSAGIDRTVSDTLRAYFFGMFINTFGVGTVGGDLARGLAIMPHRGERTASLATVIADRVHGLMVLLTIGAIAILIVRPPILGPYAGVLSVLCILGLLAGWFFGPKLLLMIFHADHRFGHLAVRVASAFPRKPKPFLTATAISAVFHTLQIMMHYLIAVSLGAPLSLAYIFATVPLVNAASTIPISTNGIGIREAGYVLLFVPVGVSQESAVAFGAIWIVTVTIVSAICGSFAIPPAAGKLLHLDIENLDKSESEILLESPVSLENQDEKHAVGQRG